MEARELAGYFITFEGIENSGKSTQMHKLSERLAAMGLDYIKVREPGGTRIGERIRAVLLDATLSEMSPWSEVLLYAAARAQLVAEVIRPALDAGKIVLCDRYIDSSLAYQGAGLHLGVESVAEINHRVTLGLMPDLTLLYDLPAETALARQKDSRDRIEQRSLDYYLAVREAYLAQARAAAERIVRLNARDPVEEVAEATWQVVAERLKTAGYSLEGGTNP